MKTMKINVPEGYEICEKTSTFENIVFKEISNNFDKIFKYHNTSQEEFDKKYEGIPFHVKAYAKGSMLASFYNKGWIPNWEDFNERKYYAWFYMDKFRLNCLTYYCSRSSIPARLCYKNEKDLLEAIELYPEVFKESKEFNQ